MTEAPTNSPLARRLLVAAALIVSFLLVALDLGLAHYGTPADELFYHEASRRHIAWLAVIGKPHAFSDETINDGFGWQPEFVIHPTFSRWCSGLAWLVGHRWLGLDEIVSFTAVQNLRSQRVMQRLNMSRDPAEDFDHPALAGHPLQRHVLYRLRRERWRP